jgi:hypothetical protein
VYKRGLDRARNDKMPSQKKQPGPTSQENWKAALAGEAKPVSIYEVEVYSDVRLIGSLVGPAALGPYSAINLVPVPDPSPGSPVAGLVLRVERYLDDPGAGHVDFEGGTDASRYHGGSADDEIAALLALSFGCRFQVGAHVRVFDRIASP